jgi:hypothetical protein
LRSIRRLSCLLLLQCTLIYPFDASAQYGAAFVSQTVPVAMIAGQSYAASVTMANVGSTIWTNSTGAGTPNSYSLGSQNPQDSVNWGLEAFPNRVPVIDSVQPNATAIFKFNVVAPTTAGVYNFQWRMVQDGVTWFGDTTPNVAVVVTPAAAQFNPDAQIVSQNVPSSMMAGLPYPVSITLKNTGNTTWSNTTGPGTPNAYSLGAQNPQDNVNWRIDGFPNRVPVTGSVPPGTTTTFNFDVVAPAIAGTYDFQWQMVDDYVAWFGGRTPNVKVSVLPLSGFFPNAKFVSQSVPSSMTAGERYPVSVTLKNTGNTTWINTTGPGTPNAYSLGAQNPQDNVKWGIDGFPNRVGVTGSVSPGATTTFRFDVVAPPTAGIYDFQWQMVDDYVAWFGAPTQNASVVVAAPLNFVPGAISFDTASSVFAQPIIGDVDGDGWVEPFGTINDGTGRLTVLSAEGMGLRNLFSDTRPYDLRIADLDGDACPDLIAQGYSPYSAGPNVESRALLYFSNGAGQYIEDPAFAQMNMNGRGEGVVIADFNNDGSSDVYLPFYTFGMSDGSCVPAEYCPNAPQSYLLKNDGTGRFSRGDVSGSVDLALPPGGQPEGAQAVDINDDGRIDLYVAGHLFLNQSVTLDGRVDFVDCDCGIPTSSVGRLVEEGAKFLDWNNDGKLDVILHDAYGGPQLYENVGTRTAPLFRLRSVRGDGTHPQFGEKLSSASGTTYASISYCASYGLNIHDLDNDGLEDVLVAGSLAEGTAGCDYPNVVFRNTGVGFESVTAGGISGSLSGGIFGFGDIDRDGKIDVMYPAPFPYYFVNATDMGKRSSITVDVRGSGAQQNQHGRVVRISLPSTACGSSDQAGCTLTRVVDGGSGYHSQNQYPILVGTPYAGEHAVDVVFPDPQTPGATVTVHTSVAAGQFASIVAPSLQFPAGRVAVFDHPPQSVSCQAR